MSEILIGVLRMPPELFWSDDEMTRLQHDNIRREAADEIDRLRARLAAPDVQGEPVAVMYEDGSLLSKADCGDSFDICCKVQTPLYATPQPADQQPAISDEIPARTTFGGPQIFTTVGQQPECGCCGQTVKCDDDCDAVVLRKANQNPAPDVAGLEEALTELCDEIDKHEIHDAISKTSISWFKRKARGALAAHRKQGGEA